MHPVALFALCGLASYLLGAIPFGYLVARARHVDIRSVGSGNIGATNVFRSVGKGWGSLTLLCDVLKGFVPAFVLPRAALCCLPPELYTGLAVLCGALAVVGHNWPVFLGFKGGKGVATSLGMLLGIAPGAVLIGLVGWILLFLATRYVSVASMAAAVAVAIGGWFLYAPDGKLLPTVLTLLGALIVWRHRANIGRLAAGTENRFEFGRKRPAPADAEGAP